MHPPQVSDTFISGEGVSRPMDTIVIIMFGSVLCSVTALSFMELRRIRKKLESNSPLAPLSPSSQTTISRS
jgi:hypothetical protein